MILLLRWKLHLWWRSITGTESKRLSSVLLTVFALVWIFLAFAAIRSLFSVLKGLEGAIGPGAAPHLAGGLLSALYLVSLAVCLFTACGASFVVMYSSSDLELLFAAPLRVGQIFCVKFCEMLVSVAAPMLLITVPIMLGFGAGVGAAWLYYPAVLLLALCTLLWPTALGAVINLLIMRIVPPYQVREVGVALGSLLGGLIYALIQFGGRSMGSLDVEQIALVTGSFNFAPIGISPTWWLAQATLEASRGDWSGFFFRAGLVAVSALVFFALCLFLVQKAFYGGWAGSGEIRRRRKKVRPRGKGLGRRLGTLLPNSVVLAVAGKEIKMITRDLREWSQAIYMIVVIGAATIAPMLGRGNPLADEAHSLPQSFLFFMLFLFVSLLSSSLALGAVAREGGSWPLLRSSPLESRQILWGKLVGITPLVLAVALAASFGLTHFLGGGRFFITALFLFLVTPGLVALNIAAGTNGPKFAALDPRKRVSVSSTLLSLFLEVVYGAVVALAVMLGAVDFWSGTPSPAGLLGFLLLLGAGIAAVLVPIAVGGRSIDTGDFGIN